MKKIASFMMSILLGSFFLGAISGCGQNVGNGLKIGFFIYDASDTFMSELADKVLAEIPEETTVEVRDAGNSQAVQNQQIVELIEDGFDLFIINAVDRLACGSIVEKCSNEGIPIIFVNREPLEGAMTGENVYYVGAAADSLGEKQADMVAELFGKNFAGSAYDKNDDGIVQLVILKGEQGHQDAEKRTETCVRRLKALGFEIEILATEAADWTRGDAYTMMQKLYLQYGDEIELIFSNNDDMALGAIDYMVEIGKFKVNTSAYNQPFVVVGVDGTQVGLQAIADGLLYGTVLNDSDSQANAVVSLVDHIMHEKDMESYPYEITNNHYIYIDGEYILREDLAKYDI